MKVTRPHLMAATLVLAGILIVYGVLKIALKLDLGKAVEDNLPNFVFIAAAGIFVWNRKLWGDEEKARKEKEAAEAAQAEVDAPADDTPKP